MGFGLGAVVRVSLRGAGLFRSAGAAAGGLRGTTEAGLWGVRALGRNPGLPFAVWPRASHLVEFSFLKMVSLTLLVPHLCPLTLTSVHSITWTRHLCRCPRQGFGQNAGAFWEWPSATGWTRIEPVGKAPSLGGGALTPRVPREMERHLSTRHFYQPPALTRLPTPLTDSSCIQLSKE